MDLIRYTYIGVFLLALSVSSGTALAQSCDSLTPDIYSSSDVILNLDANVKKSIIDGDGNDATSSNFSNYVNKWINAENLENGPELIAPTSDARPRFESGSTGGLAENYLRADGVDDTLQYSAGLRDQSFTVYFVFKSFLDPQINQDFRAFMSGGDNSSDAGSWQFDLSTRGASSRDCPKRNQFSWLVRDGSSAHRLCGRSLDNKPHSFYLTYDASTKEAKFFIDGLLHDSRSIVNELNIDRIKLWVNRNDINYQEANIYEFGMLNFAATNFSDLADYLNCKWGTVNDDMDLQVTISPSVMEPNIGDIVTYTVNVSNRGPNGTSEIVISSVIPNGLTYMLESITGGQSRNDSDPVGVGLSWNIGPLLAGESVTLIFKAMLDTGTDGRLIVSTAETKSYLGVDVDETNNTGTGQIRAQGIDLKVLKTANTVAPGLGQQVDYTITVSNLGTNSATGVELTDILDPRLTYVSSSAKGGVLVNDSNPGTGIIWTLGTINSNQVITLTFSAIPNVIATIPNSATITAVDQAESNVSNNTDSVDIIVAAADLKVQIQPSTTVVNEGDTVTLTISVENVSAQELTSAEIISVVPIGLNYVPSSALGEGVTPDDTDPGNNGIIFSIGTIEVGEVITMTYKVIVNPGAALNYGTRRIEGHLQASNPVDENLSNNASDTTITIVNFDASITKTVNPMIVIEGGTASYTLTVNNAQENTLNTILVRDIVPDGVTYVADSWESSIAGTTVDESSPATGLEFTIPQLRPVSEAPFNQAIITFDVTVDAGAASLRNIENRASIISLMENDTNTTNDTSVASITPITFDIGISQEVSESTLEEGEEVVVTLTLTNNNALVEGTNIIVNNIVPVGLTYVPDSIEGGDSNNDLTPLTGLNWTINSLPNASSTNLIFRATVDIGARAISETITNVAMIQSLDQIDSVIANNSVEQILTIAGLDLSIETSVNNTTPTEGEEITYTLRVRSLSTQDATGVEVTNLVPAGLTYVQGSIFGGDNQNVLGSGLTWTIDTIAGGVTTELTFRVKVDPGAKASEGDITNTSEITSLDQTDDQAANDRDSVVITIKGIDLELIKTVSNATPAEGEEITYTITVENLSTQVATDVVIGDVVPAGVTYVQDSIRGGTERNDLDPGTVTGGLTWTIGSIGAGVTSTLTFRSRVNAGAHALGVITNTAKVLSFNETEENPLNNNGSRNITAQEFDVAVTKRSSKTSVQEGETFTYTINVDNRSSVAVGTNIVIKDVVPAGLTYVQGSIGGVALVDESDPVTAGLEWRISSLAPNSDIDLTFQATVDLGAQAFYREIINSASRISSDQIDSDSLNDTGEVTVAVVGLDLSIETSVNNTTPTEGEEITYTLRVRNLSTQDATGVEVTNLVPAGLTYVQGSIFGGDNQNVLGSGLTWTIDTIAGGVTTELTFRVKVDPGAKASEGDITNTSEITSLDQTDDQAANDRDSVVITIKGIDLELIKTVSNATPAEGEEITYTITVENLSTQVATDVVIGDVVPAGVTYVQDSIRGGTERNDLDPGTVTGGLTWTIGSIGAGVTSTLTFRSRVNAGAHALGVITNTAKVLSFNETEENPLNNNGSRNITAQEFDVAVTKRSSKTSVQEGETFTYTINVDNRSSVAVGTNIVIKDVVPAGLTYVQGSIGGVALVDESDPVTAGLEWRISSLAPNSDIDLTFQATVDLGAQAFYREIINSASRISSDQIDSDSLNDTGEVTVAVVGLDLSIETSVNNTTPTEGEEITYTLRVRNLSTQDATGVEVTNLVPAGLTYVQGSIFGGDNQNVLGSGLTWTIDTIAGGVTTELTFRVKVDPGAKASEGDITNTSEITSLDQTDDQAANDRDSVVITIKGIDLELIKTVSNATPAEGEEITYTITVENLSTQVATDVVIGDVVPAGVTYVQDSIRGGTERNDLDPGTVTGGLTWTIGSIGAGVTSTLTFRSRVNAGAHALGVITNTAKVLSFNETEENPLNNNGSRNITAQEFDVAVTKRSSKTSVQEGETFTYTINVDNRSSVAVGTNIVIKDVVPAGLTYVQGSIGGVALVDESDPVTAGLEWRISSLAPNSDIDLTFQATVDLGAQAFYREIINSASRISSDQIDSDSLNDTGEVTVAVVGLDLSIETSVNNTTPTEGEEITYTLRVRNLSTQDATGVEVTNLVPAGLTYVQGSIFGGDNQNVLGSGLTWTIDTIAGGVTTELTFRVKVDPGAKASEGDITNTSEITSLDQTDDQAANDRDSVVITIKGIDLELIKTVSNATPAEGEEITYTITVENLSTQVATDVVIGDVVPAGVTYVQDSIRGGTERNDLDPGTVTGGLTWTIGSIGAGVTSTLTFRSRVNAGAHALGVITNTAKVLSFNETEENPLNNIDAANIEARIFDIGIVKTVSESNPEEGEVITYTITVTNNAIDTIGTGLEITDVVPEGVTYVQGSIRGGTERNDLDPYTITGGLTWNINSIASETDIILTFDAVVNARAKDNYGIITNTAQMTNVDQADSTPENDQGSVDITVRGIDLSIVKTVDNQSPEEGAKITYTIIVSNLSGQTATNIVVEDIVPDGVTYVLNSIKGGTQRNDENHDTTGLVWVFPTLSVGAVETLSFQATVDPRAKDDYGTITNTVNLKLSDQSEEDNTNNTDGAMITVSGLDLEVIKTVDNANPLERSEVIYKISVANLSQQEATNVVLKDLVPAGVTYVQNSIRGGTSRNDSTPTSGDGLTWTHASLLAGETKSVTFRAQVDAGSQATYGAIINSAEFSSADQSEDNVSNNISSALITIKAFDLSVLKTVSNFSPEEGEEIEYIITVTNKIDDEVGTGIVIGDIVPEGITYVDFSMRGGSLQDDTTPTLGDGLVWHINTLAGGDSVSLRFKARVDIGAKVNSGGTITNTARLINLNQVDSNQVNNEGLVDITVRGLDLEVLKVVNNPTPVEFETVTYTISVKNLSSQPATNVVLKDLVPAGITYRQGTIAGGDIQNDLTPDDITGLTWTINTLAPNQIVDVMFNAQVNAGAYNEYGTITNSAEFSSADQSEDNLGNNVGAVDIIVQALDIEIEKQISNTEPIEGQIVTYTLLVKNFSGATATNINITDIVPDGVTYVPGSIAGQALYNDINPDTTGLTWLIESLSGVGPENIASLTFQATVDVGARGLGSVINTGTITSLDQTDSNLDNDSDTADFLARGVDIVINKQVNESMPNETQVITYSLVVTNSGPADATNIVVRDILPPGLTYQVGTMIGGDLKNESDPTGAGLRWTINSLLSGESKTVTFNAQIDSGAGGMSITNTSDIFSIDQTEENLTNNTDSVTVTVTTDLDIQVAKTSNKSNYEEGEEVTYTITVTNHGPSRATGLVIKDIVPLDIIYTTASMLGGDAQIESSPYGTGLKWTINSLTSVGPLNSVDLTFKGVVGAGANLNTLITNSASYTSVDQTEINPVNNVGTRDINILNNLDISLTKAVSNTTPNIGEIVTYTIGVTNAGPTQASSVVINDIIPTGLFYMPRTDSGVDSVNSTDPSGTGVDFSIGKISSGQTKNITFDVMVLESSNLHNPITNTAQLSSSAQTDINDLNNSGNVDLNVNSDLDIQITKTVSNILPFELEEVVYTVNVKNNGPAAASDIKVVDLLDSNLSYIAGSMVGGDHQDDRTPGSGDGLKWTINQLLKGENLDLIFRAAPKEGTSGRAIVNTGNLLSSAQLDIDNSNDTSLVSIDVRNDADLEIIQAVTSTTPSETDTLTYTLTLRNNGPTTSRDVVVSNLVPTGLTYVENSISGGHIQNDLTPSTASGLEWTVHQILSGEVSILTYEVTVDSGFAGEVISTVSNITSFISTEVDFANNTSRIDVTVDNTLDLFIEKQVDKNNPLELETLTYTINVSNKSLKTRASNITITDIIPPGLTYVTGSINGGSTRLDADPAQAGLNWTIIQLGPLQTETLIFQVIVNAKTAGDVIVNTLTRVALDQVDTNTTPDDLSEAVTVQNVIDLQVIKTASSLQPALLSEMTYTITVENFGPSVGENIQITDIVPDFMDYVLGSMTGADDRNELDPAGTGLVWIINEIAIGATKTLTFKVISGLGAKNLSITNTVSYTHSYLDTQSNDTLSVTVNLESRSDVQISKVVDNSTPSIGEIFKYIITVTNNGPVTVESIQLNDLLPAGLTYISDNSLGTYDSVTGNWGVTSFLPVGASISLEISASPLPGTGGSIITNTVTNFILDVIDTNLTSDDYTEDIRVIEKIDVYIDGIVVNSNPEEGDFVTLTYNVTNNGPKVATNMTLQTIVPEGLTFIPGTMVGADNVNNIGATLTWDINTLAVGVTETISFQVSVDVGSGGSTLSTVLDITAIDQTEDTQVVDNNELSLIIKNEADIFFSKTANLNAVDEGDQVVFTIQVTNNGPAQAKNVEIYDILSTFFTLNSQVPTQGAYAGSKWSIGTLNMGQVETLILTVDVNPGASGQVIVNRLDNQSQDQIDLNIEADDLEETVVVGTNTDLQILVTIIDDPGADEILEENQVFTYQIEVVNNGPNRAENLSMDFFAPPQVDFINNGVVASAGTYFFPTWSIPAVNSGSSATLKIQSKVKTGIFNQVITAQVIGFTLDQFDSNKTPDDLTEVFTVDDKVDLHITKTVDVQAPQEGDEVTFTVRVENKGPANATGIQIQDIFPSTLLSLESYFSTKGIFDSNTMLWDISSLPVNDTAVLNLRSRVELEAGGIDIINTVQLNSFDQTDSNITPDDLSEVLSVGNNTNLEISKTVSNRTPNEGELITYTITVRNNGPSGATNFSLTDILPAGVTFISARANLGSFQDDVWSIRVIPNGFISTLEIETEVDYGQGGSVIRNEISSVTFDQNDSIGASNDILFADILVKHETDLFITKITDESIYSEGEMVRFTINVTNNGPALAENVSVQDQIPAGLTYLAHNESDGTAYSISNGVWTLGDIAVDESKTLTIDATANVGTKGQFITNTVSNITLDETDLNHSNDDLDETIQIVNELDLVVSIISDQVFLNEQDDVTFTVVVSNIGPARGTNVGVLIALPVLFNFESYNITGGSFDSNTRIWSIPTIDRNEFFTLEITAKALEGSGGQTATTQAQVLLVDQEELETSNDIDTTDVFINNNNNLILTKIVDNNTPREGEVVTFTLTVENQGPAQARNLEIIDAMPAGLTFASSAAATHGSYLVNKWIVGNLSMGETASIQILATVDKETNGQIITNIITNVLQSGTDIDPLGDDLEEVIVVDKQVDLMITKTVDDSNSFEGDLIEFTIQATNNGPIAIDNLVIDDTLPTGLTFSSASIPSHGTFVKPQWIIPRLNIGEIANLEISATVDAGTTNTRITNIISNYTMDQFDSTDTDDLEESVNIDNGTDLIVTKIVDNPTPYEQSLISYTITVYNNGPARATNVTIEDVIPAGLTLLSSTASQGIYTANLWSVGTLENAQTETLTLIVSIDIGQSGNTIVNQILTVDLDQIDLNPAGDDLEESITVENDLDLDINLSVDKTIIDEGEEFTYTIVVRNNGPNQASNFKIIDDWPSQLELISADSLNFIVSTRTWNIGDLASGETVALNIKARALKGTSGQIISNTISYTLDQIDSTVGDTLSADVTVNSDLDLVIFKTVNNARPNEDEEIIFTIIVENNGPARATNIFMKDILPAQLTFVSATAFSGNTFSYPDWVIPQLDAGDVVELSIVARVNSGTSGQTVINTISDITLDQTDINLSPDDLSEQIDIRNESDIYVTKNINTGVVYGESATAIFTITVENKGPLAVNGLEIDDDLDDRFILISSTASKGSFLEPVWSVGSLLVGEKATLNLEVRPNEDAQNTKIINKISRIESDKLDSNTTPDDLIAELNILGNSSVIIRIKTDKDVASMGDLLGVELEVESLVTDVFEPLKVVANLPQGLSYIKGTTKVLRAGDDGIFETEDDVFLDLDIETVKSLSTSEKLAVDGKELSFLMSTTGLEKYKIIFQTRVGSSIVGNGVSIGAFAEFENFKVTSEVRALIVIQKSVIFDITSIIGKVFHDRDGDGYQDESIVRGLKVYGGTSLENVRDTDSMIDRGNGFKKISGDVKKGYRLGALSGRSSRNDYSKTTYVKLKIPIKESIKKDLGVVTSEGTALLFKSDGRVIEELTGLRRKGMSSQDILVSHTIIEEEKEKFLLVTINNMGVDEEGIPGVRIYGVNGLAHETDGFGRFHIPDIEFKHNRGHNYILKVDPKTLPKNSTFTTENPRVIKLTGGLFTKFNFGVKIPILSEGKVFQSKKISESILFNVAKSNIRESEVNKVEKLTKELSNLPLDLNDGKVFVQGFADFRGLAEKNKILSMNRAKTIMNKIQDVTADLKFLVDVDNTAPHEQDIVKFVAQVKNKGLSSVSNLEINLPLPEQFKLHGRIKSSLGNYNGNRWFIKNLEGKSGAKLEFSAKVKVLTSNEEFMLPVAHYIYEGLQAQIGVKDIAAIGRIKNELDFNITTNLSHTEVDERENFNYVITGVNNGPAAATKLVVDLIQDKSINIQNISVSHGVVTKDQWIIGTLMSGEKAVAKINANSKVGSATKEMVVGVATVYAEQVDIDKTKDIETLSIQVRNNLDLVIASSFNVKAANEGDQIRFLVKAYNKGPIKATNVGVAISFDEEFKLLSTKATKGSFKDNIWSINFIDYGNSEEIVFVLTPKPRSGSSILKGMVYDVSLDQIDLELTKDIFEDEIQILNNTDIILTKTVSDTYPEEGDEVFITWRIINKGPAVAQDLVLEDIIDSSLIKLGDLKVSKGSASGAKWTILELLKGESAKMKVSVKILEGTGGSTILDPVEKFTHEQKDLLKNSIDTVKIRVASQTNIILVKEFSKSRADEGDKILTSTRIKNMGPAMANNIRIKDIIHSHLVKHKYVSVSKNTNLISNSWLIPTLKVHEKAELTWLSEITPGSGGFVIEDKIDEIKMREDFVIISKDSLSPKLRINNKTDLLTKISSNVKNVNLGEEFELSYFVSNQGPAMVKNLKLNPPLHRCLILVSSRSTVGDVRKKTLSVDKLGFKESLTMTLRVKPKYNCNKDELINAFGIIDMKQTEISDKGNTTTVSVKINKEVDYAVVISESKDTLEEGEEVEFIISQSNLGPAFVNKSELDFEISPSLELIKTNLTKGNVEDLTWTVKDIKYKDIETLKIRVKVKFKTSNTKAFIRIKRHKIDKDDLNKQIDIYSKEYVIENKSDINIEIKALKKKINVPYVTYKYTIRNNGPAVATNIKIKPLFDQNSLKSINRDIATDTDYSARGIWFIKEIFPKQVVDMIWTFELNNFTTPVKLAGYTDFSMNQVDSELTLDVQKSAIKVNNTAKVRVKKSVSRKDIYEGELFNYIIKIQNVGKQIASNIEIKDYIDKKYLIFTSAAKASQGDYSNGVWKLKKLRAGETARVVIPVKFIGDLQEDIKFFDPIDSFTMEQNSYYNLKKLKKFKYKVKNITRTLSGEYDGKNKEESR